MPEKEEGAYELIGRLLRKMGEKGWWSLSWPEKYGGQSSMMKQAIVTDVMSYHRGPIGGVAVAISGPTIVQVGSEEMKREWLPRIASGEAPFWLGYSEPNAGSDLASLRTSAVEDGDHFVVNGQKVWSTGAHVGGYCWLLARTDPKAPRHKAASLMIVPNDTPGVTIKPIINICGLHSFNEVFFDDVRVPKKNVVGEVNRGFYNVMLALQFERLIVASGGFRRVLEELVQYARETEHGGTRLADLPHVRRKLAEMSVEIDIFYSYYWQTATMLEKGKIPELEASALKLFFSELSVRFANAATDVLGLYGPLDRGSKWAPFDGRVAMGYLDSLSGPIGAGSSEIQRNIIATRGLGLPRE
jgi:hypothetical protein